MNSEKVKEILKKRIENINPWETHALEYHKGLLDLINELEKCSEKWQKLCADEVALNTSLKERIKESENLCNKTYEDLTKEIDRLEEINKELKQFNKNILFVNEQVIGENKQLENRVKELEEGIAKSMLGCEFLPECTNEKLEQFAEMLKEKCTLKYLRNNVVFFDDIDETLKEFFYEFEEIIPSIMADKIDKLVEEFLTKK